MPTSSSLRKVTPRRTATHQESIAAFEQWQRNWSASFPNAPAPEAPKRPLHKHAAAVHHSSAHSR